MGPTPLHYIPTRPLIIGYRVDEHVQAVVRTLERRERQPIVADLGEPERQLFKLNTAADDASFAIESESERIGRGTGYLAR